MEIRKVNSKEVLQLLKDNDLPTSDIIPEESIFLGAFSKSKLVGCIGLQKIGEFGLLRSLAVESDYRRNRIGNGLTGALIKEAMHLAIPALYLLTTDAESFFKKAGFSKIDKSEAPQSVKETKQYSEICSDSAVVMRMILS